MLVHFQGERKIFKFLYSTLCIRKIKFFIAVLSHGATSSGSEYTVQHQTYPNKGNALNCRLRFFLKISEL